MEFLSGLWSAVKAVGGAIASGLKSVAGYVLDNAPSIISGVASWVKENILGLEETPSYNPQEATVDETKKINELMEKCITSYKEEAEKYDELAQFIIEEQFELLEKKLLEINETSSEKVIDDYIFKSFHSNLHRIKKELDKIYSKQISNVFSLNNNELLDILSLNKGAEKKQSLQNLAINTITQANKVLTEELSEFISEQQSFIIERLNSYMQKVKNDFVIAKNATEEILSSVEKDKSYRIKLESDYQNLIEKMNLLKEVFMEEK